MTTSSSSGIEDGESVNLLELAAAALSASIVAADQITGLAWQRDNNDNDTDTDQEDSSNPHIMNIRLKEDGSFVTNADLAAQQIIVQALQQVSTRIRLVGEESLEGGDGDGGAGGLCTVTGHEDRASRVLEASQQELTLRYNYNCNNCGGDDDDDEGEGEGENDSHTRTTAIPTPLPLAQTTPPLEEEDSQEEEEIRTTRTSTSTPTLTPTKPLQDYVVHANRVSVFIDPLDGTKAYARGDYDPVSILIAIILDATPCFGVICKPFGYPQQTSVLDTGCVAIYGGTLLGGAYTAGSDRGWGTRPLSSSSSVSSRLNKSSSKSNGVPKTEAGPRERAPTASTITSTESEENPVDTSLPLQPDVNLLLPRAVISSSRSQGVVQEFVTHLGNKGMVHPTPLLISGAGEKSLRILLRNENEGLWFFPKAGTSLWDVAASDALLRATGGRLTDKHGKDMDYRKSRLEAENDEGVVACYDHSLHTECIKLFLEGTWSPE